MLCQVILLSYLIEQVVKDKYPYTYRWLQKETNVCFVSNLKLAHLKHLKLVRQYRVFKWRNKRLKVPQNNLQPMSVIEVKECSPRSEFGLCIFEANLMLYKYHKHH